MSNYSKEKLRMLALWQHLTYEPHAPIPIFYYDGELYERTEINIKLVSGKNYTRVIASAEDLVSFHKEVQRLNCKRKSSPQSDVIKFEAGSPLFDTLSLTETAWNNQFAVNPKVITCDDAAKNRLINEVNTIKSYINHDWVAAIDYAFSNNIKKLSKHYQNYGIKMGSPHFAAMQAKISLCREQPEQVYKRIEPSVTYEPAHKTADGVEHEKKKRPVVGDWVHNANLLYYLLYPATDNKALKQAIINAWIGEPIEPWFEPRYTNGGEYLVLTDEEADKAQEEYFDSCLEEVIVEDAQSKYFDRAAWKADAKIDGRGHGLATYDGEEIEITVEYYEGGEMLREDFYIYRTN
jgi:hypothetical protein